jgi:hypothetical protein
MIQGCELKGSIPMPMRRIVVMLGAFAGVLFNLPAAAADEQTLPYSADQKTQASMLLVDSRDAIAKSVKVRRDGVRHRRSRSHADARICLEAANRSAIILCAEKYR